MKVKKIKGNRELRESRKVKRVSPGRTMKKIDIKELIVKELPALLKKEPELKNYISSLFEDRFAGKSETEKRIERLYEEIRDLREETKALREEMKAMREESEKRWEENQRRWEEITKRLDEHMEEIKALKKRDEELMEEIRALRIRSDEQMEEIRALRIRSDELMEEIKALRKRDEELMEEIRALRKRQDVQIGALGSRWGMKTERSFRNALKGILEESFPIKVERYEVFDDKGIVFDGHPGIVELDIIIKDNEVIVAELKSSISVGDILLFEKKVKFFEEREGRKPAKKIIISPMIEPKAEELIEKLGITAYTDIPESGEEL